GIAQYVEKKITGFEFTNPFKDGKSIECYDFKDLEKNFDQLNQQIVYWQSLKVVEYIVDSYGEDKLLTILNYLGQGNNMASAIEKSLAVDYDTFIDDFYSNLSINY
ncbi:MAG: hypothetical protein GX790_04950, partial [Syntrophomonadaceae bacterium]|nr:hypothetical protein [Syntrophomonadaceae bacterium]